MIEIRGLCKRYGDFTALHRVDLTVGKGEFVVILGASGAGKPTLLRCINHLAEPSEGEIHVDGERSRGDRAGLRKVRRDVAMIFQHYNVVPHLSVLKNVLTGRLGSMPAIASWFQVFPAKDIAIARECLRRVELDHKSDLRTDTLSGGQKQRVGIARALAADPEMLLLDEPFGALDAFTREQVQQLLLKVWTQAAKPMFLITHDIEEAVFLATDLILLGAHPGRITERLELDFGRRHAEGGESARAIKSDPQFIATREHVLSRVFAGQAGTTTA